MDWHDALRAERCAHWTTAGASPHETIRRKDYDQGRNMDTSKTPAADAAPFDLVGFIMEYEQEEMDPQRMVEGFSHLVRTGHAWSLQGHYGRTAQALIERGILDRQGNIDQDALDDILEAF